MPESDNEGNIIMSRNMVGNYQQNLSEQTDRSIHSYEDTQEISSRIIENSQKINNILEELKKITVTKYNVRIL